MRINRGGWAHCPVRQTASVRPHYAMGATALQYCAATSREIAQSGLGPELDVTLGVPGLALRRPICPYAVRRDYNEASAQLKRGETAMRSYSKSLAFPWSGVAALAVAAIIAAPTRPQAQVRPTAQGAWGGNTNGVGHYADVNGIKLYYETLGTCRPLILLHGGLGAIEMFGPNLPPLAKGRQVIAVDLQGHGRTADIDRPLSVQLMADDIAALIKHLGLASADVMGYSLGGGVALQTAIRHPEVVRKLVVVSTPFRRDAFYPDILAQQGQVTAAAAERRELPRTDGHLHPAVCRGPSGIRQDEDAHRCV